VAKDEVKQWHFARRMLKWFAEQVSVLTASCTDFIDLTEKSKWELLAIAL
jgi:hypothetical protein